MALQSNRSALLIPCDCPHFHFDRAMRFNSSVISRMLASNSRSKRIAALSLISVRSGLACGKAFLFAGLCNVCAMPSEKNGVTKFETLIGMIGGMT